MTSRAVTMPSDAETIRRDGQTVVFVAVERVLLGAIAVADPLRETARETLELLRSHGVRHVDDAHRRSRRQRPRRRGRPGAR